MGCCLSKTSPISDPPPISNPEPETPKPENEPQIPPTQLETDKKEELKLEKEEEKEGFVIQHRKSSDKRSEQNGLLNSDSDGITSEGNASKIISMAANGSVVRTSSCTKEEVDAILIQCGRLSRSSSAISGTPKKYSGSKRSHDFDKENTNNVSFDGVAADVNEDDDERLRRRQSRGSHRRTTPSRSRERDPPSQRSRRVSRSPGKRSESPNTSTGNGGGRPGKMVSVPAASKASLSMEKSNNNGGSVKRVLVKRNVSEGSRAATPPRSRSPARSRSALVKNQPSPVRNSSRKSEISPYRRRTPLTDLDMNSLPFQPLKNKLGVEANHRRARSRGGELDAEQDELAAAAAPTLARSRSSRKSRDFDVNVEALLNQKPAGNYNSLLLQDIQNFHQKATPPLKLPECVSKACSIVEAVADLNLNSSCSRSVGRVNAGDELTEPSIHKFVNVGGIDGELDEQESTGSNSFVTGGGGGNQNQWVSSSSCWDEGASPASFQRVSAASSKPRSGVAAPRTGAGR